MPIPDSSDSPTIQGSDATIESVPAGKPQAAPPGSDLSPGAVLSERYQIVDTLGVGGMGSVYKAFDRRLARIVALKTIHPELAAAPQMMKRFKQEVLLAQKITHKNVVRIFDIGEDQKTPFITMDFIEGVSLKDVVQKRGAFPPKEAVATVRQVCLALEAAHSEGVVHRDLKPQNIMIDNNQHIVVMDFGIARSAESSGATQTGTLLGTPDYMSPEQARMEEVDARSDIYSLGLILYELLTGKLPFKGATIVESMFKRTKERAVPPNEIDANIPKAANDIVVKCLEPDRERRYQNVTEILEDLESFDPSKKAGVADHVKVRLKKAARYRNWAAGFAVVLVALVAGFLLRNRFATPASPLERPPVTVLIADFENTTGDDVFSGTLESTSVTALEEAPFVNIYRSSDAKRVLAQIQKEKDATKLDEAAARLVGMREGVGVIITGLIAREGTGYQISARAIEPSTGKVIGSSKVDAANNQLVLKSIGKLIAPIRTALGDTTPESAQLAAAEAYTASSLEAARAFALGKELADAGKREDAIPYLQEAVKLDPNLGRAYLGLATTYVGLKKQTEAGENYKKALALVDRMSEHEKYRTLSNYYLGYARNYELGIETLRKLVLLYPADALGHQNLGYGYAHTGKMADAAAASRRAVELGPTNQRRYNYSNHLMLSGDLVSAMAEADRLIKDSNYEQAYLTLALAALLRGDVAKSEETYSRLEKVSPRGASLSKMGQADLKIYAGRYQDAVRILLAGIADDEKQANAGELAYKLIGLAEAYNALGRKTDAAAAADKSAKASSLDEIQFLAAWSMVEAGEYAKAVQAATDLENKLQDQTKSLALIIKAETALKQKQVSPAIDAYREAQKLYDSWLSHLLLGKAYVEAGHFAEGLPELELADKRASEASDLFVTTTTTLRYLPPLYYWLGRAQEGMGSSDAARKNYQRYIRLREQADSADKLLADAKKRAG